MSRNTRKEAQVTNTLKGLPAKERYAKIDEIAATMEQFDSSGTLLAPTNK